MKLEIRKPMFPIDSYDARPDYSAADMYPGWHLLHLVLSAELSPWVSERCAANAFP